MILAAAKIVKAGLIISISKDYSRLEQIKKSVGKDFSIIEESEAEFIEKMDNYERIRTCSDTLPKEFYKKAAKTGKYIIFAKPIIEGRIELLHYVKEQSIAFEYHRYGSITDKVEE
jgi:RHH-type proline utilization regulon transcriptional repressor/proline dehydrogenase/delta 1-pyrroline-5-carboxylate dehydrogenase